MFNPAKKIVFVSGTRADFGKIKPLLLAVEAHTSFELFVVVTGMHLEEKYGFTLLEIERCGFKNVLTFSNTTHESTMDLTLAKTIQGLSEIVHNIQPNLIVLHGDRVEALASALVGALQNILVAHLEGGEVSGTIDELIRHATSKMSHLHFVANANAKKRLVQMGENSNTIFVIGSPDIDIMRSEQLPNIHTALSYYEIPFDEYAIALYHPVTTEITMAQTNAEHFVNALLLSEKNYIVIYPNNDLGSEYILNAYQKIQQQPHFKIFPSIRFEYFLTLLKNAQFMIGNSSAGIREAPFYGIPTIDIGSRQQNRAEQGAITTVSYHQDAILEAIQNIQKPTNHTISDFGTGNSSQLFIACLEQPHFWETSQQKKFIDI